MQLYQTDNQLPGVELLLDPPSLTQRIQSWMGEGELSIANIRYKPETSCLVSYRLQTGDQITFIHAKAFSPADWPTRKKKIAATSLFDDDLSFAVSKFPTDSELPGMTELTENPTGFLSRVLFREIKHWNFQRFQVLAYKPNRRFVARLDFDSGKKLVLKMHDESSFHVALNSALALKKCSQIDTPRRRGKSSNHNTLAFEWIPGTPCELDQVTASQRAELMEMIFAYLDQLHRPIDSRKVKLSLRRPTLGLEPFADYLGTICPPCGDIASHISCELMKTAPTGFAPELVHGDFYDRQLILQSDRIRACDFDDCCIDDSTVDFANLLSHLELRVCTAEVSNEVAEDVNGRTRDHMNQTRDQPSVRRYLWNEAACLFRLATHPFRSGSENWIQQTEMILESVAKKITSARKTIPQNKFRSESSYQDLSTIDIGRAIRNDQNFDFLEGVFEESVATSIFKNFVPTLEDQFGNYQVDKVIPRRHKPGRRCLIEFELLTDRGLRSLIGKASAKRLDRHSFKNQRQLSREHFFSDHSEDGICVPPAIAVCKPWQMWLQEKVEAVSAGELMKQQRLSDVTQRIADSLLKLHHSHFRPTREHSMVDELTIVSTRLQTMMTMLPTEEARIEQVLKNCTSICERFGGGEYVPIHRDFYQDQILFSKAKTYLVDLDLVSLGHPALDVGNFLAHLTEHGIRIHGDPEYWSREEHEIAERYLDGNPDCSRDEIEALKAVSFARHISISWTIKERSEWTSKIIDVAGDLTNQFSSTLTTKTWK